MSCEALFVPTYSGIWGTTLLPLLSNATQQHSQKVNNFKNCETELKSKVGENDKDADEDEDSDVGLTYNDPAHVGDDTQWSHSG